MSLSILVVDDSPIIRKVIKKTITMAGLDVKEVHEAAHGGEALTVLSEKWVDIVFTDLNMPEMDGGELVDKMAEDNLLVSIPVVLVTSDRNEDRLKKLQEAGIRAYIRKPFRPENFRDVVADVLDGYGEQA